MGTLVCGAFLLRGLVCVLLANIRRPFFLIRAVGQKPKRCEVKFTMDFLNQTTLKLKTHYDGAY